MKCACKNLWYLSHALAAFLPSTDNVTGQVKFRHAELQHDSFSSHLQDAMLLRIAVSSQSTNWHDANSC